MSAHKNGSSFSRKFRLSKKGKFLGFQKVVPSLTYFMNLFEYMLQNNFGVRFIWTAGFMSWILGCCFWVIDAEFVSLFFISASIVFCLLAILDTANIDLSELPTLRRAKLGPSVYVLIISISVIATVFFKSLAAGLTTNILLLLLLYNWRKYKKTKTFELP
jgi:uncharacterized membrane protein